MYRGATLLRIVCHRARARSAGTEAAGGRWPHAQGTTCSTTTNPRSSYHKALHVSYPSAADTAAAQSRGVSPGGLIMVHGVRNGLGFVGRLHRIFDSWTDGCIAVTDAEIDEIWRSVADGTPIEIRPENRVFRIAVRGFPVRLRACRALPQPVETSLQIVLRRLGNCSGSRRFPPSSATSSPCRREGSAQRAAAHADNPARCLIRPPRCCRS